MITKKQLKYLDSWESEYILNLKNAQLVTWSDEEACEKLPKYKFVYDKYYIGKRYRKSIINLEKNLPKKYPVIVKPKVNLVGLSKGAYIAKSKEDIKNRKGMIAQEYLSGDHITSDLILKNGKVIDWFSFKCHKKKNSLEFTLFESINKVEPRVIKFIENLLPKYSGVICAESIGGYCIDVHLRPALQFFDICGGFIEQLPRFYKTGKWKKVNYEKTYSKVFRRKTDAKLKRPKIKNIPKGVRSVQLCWHGNNYLSQEVQDFFGFRYMVINGTDMNDITKYAKLLRKKIS